MRLFLLLFLLLGGLQEEVDPEAAEWFQKGEALIGTPREYSDEQAGYFEKAVQLDPEFAAARFNLALIYFKQKKYEQVIGQLEMLIALDDQDARPYELRARAYYETARFREAVLDLERAVSLDPENVELWELLAHARSRREDYAGALAAFEKIRQLNPLLPPAFYFDLAVCQQNLKRFEEAAVNYEKYLESEPADFQANFFLGLAYRDLGNPEQALKRLQTAEALEPSNTDVARALGDLLLELGRLDEARERLARSGGESAVELSNLGILAKREGRLEEAAGFFRRALEAEPDNALIWGHLGDVLAELEQPAEAAQAYQKAVELDPDDFDSLFALGTLLANNDQPLEAQAVLQRAVRVRPEAGDAWFHLGVVQERLDEDTAARESYLKALSTGTENARLHFRLAVLFARESSVDEALKHLEAAFRLDAATYVPLVLEELRNIHSDLDSIRYRAAFSRLLQEYEP